MDEGPGEHDAHLMDDDPQQTVPCARCGEHVWAYAQRCPNCGVHYSGEAWQFRYDDGGAPRGSATRWWWWLAAALAAAALLIIATGR